MTFVTPALAVAGAAAVAIPILIHLLSRQRRRPIEWAAMQFLLEAFRRQRRRLRIEQFLLLLTRCLIVLLIGLALARPILEDAGLLDRGGSRIVYFILDNGMISTVTDDSGETALEQQKAVAMEILSSVGPADRIGVITAARPAQAALSPPSTDHRAVRSLIESIEAHATPTDLSGALMALQRALESINAATGQDQVVVYLLSEFRAGSAMIDEALPDTLREFGDRITLLASEPADEAISNVQVTAIDPIRTVLVGRAGDGSGHINVRLERHGGTLDREVTRVRLRGEDIAAPEPRIIQWAPGQSEAAADFVLRLSTQNDRDIALTATIDDDALSADNNRSELLFHRSHLRAILLDRRSFGYEPSVDHYQAGQWIRRALEPFEGSPVQIVEVDPAGVSVADVRTAEIAIAPRPDLITEPGWAILRDFVDDGGLLLVMPPAELNVHQWTEQLTSSMNLPWRVRLETAEHPDGLTLADEQPSTELLRLISSELEDLLRPVIAMRTLPIVLESSQGRSVLSFEDGSPLVYVGSPLLDTVESGVDAAPQFGRGLVIYWSVAPELSWTNLPTKPLMVPLLHELVRQGLGMIRSEQRLRLGERAPIPGARSATTIVDPDGRVLAVDQAGRPQEALRRPGVYQLRDAADQHIGRLTLNVEAVAGRTETQPASAVLAWLQGSGPWTMFSRQSPAAALQTAQSGSHLSGLLLVVLLVLVLLETLMARWFSHALAEEPSGRAGGLIPTIRARLGGSEPASTTMSAPDSAAGGAA